MGTAFLVCSFAKWLVIMGLNEGVCSFSLLYTIDVNGHERSRETPFTPRGTQNHAMLCLLLCLGCLPTPNDPFHDAGPISPMPRRSDRKIATLNNGQGAPKGVHTEGVLSICSSAKKTDSITQSHP